MFPVWQVLQRNFDENLTTIEVWQKALARLPIGMWGAILPSSQSTQALEQLQSNAIGNVYERIRQYQQLGSGIVSNQGNFWRDKQ